MSLDFLAGCLGGFAGLLVGHPFDTVKVHLQTQDYKNPVYRGTYHCVKTIFMKESFSGLYRGMSSPIAGVSFINAIIFGVYGNVERHSSDPSSIRSHFLAGAMAGGAQSLISSPMELAKTRIQLQATNSGQQFKSPAHCLKHIWHTEGIRGVSRGLTITTIRDVPGLASYFVCYELLARSFPNCGAFYTLLAGGLAGSFSWLLSVPLDVLKSRIQVDGMNGQPRQYNGIVDCAVKSYRAEGAGVFTRGLTSTLLRAFPMNAACFYVVDLTLRTFGNVNSISMIDIQTTNMDTISMTRTNPDHLATKSKATGKSIEKVTAHHSLLPIHPAFDIIQHKGQMVKALIFLGACNEAVCSSDIHDMVNDLYDQYKDTNYYHLTAESAE